MTVREGASAALSYGQTHFHAPIQCCESKKASALYFITKLVPSVILKYILKKSLFHGKLRIKTQRIKGCDWFSWVFFFHYKFYTAGTKIKRYINTPQRSQQRTTKYTVYSTEREK